MTKYCVQVIIDHMIHSTSINTDKGERYAVSTILKQFKINYPDKIITFYGVSYDNKEDDNEI